MNDKHKLSRSQYKNEMFKALNRCPTKQRADLVIGDRVVVGARGFIVTKVTPKRGPKFARINPDLTTGEEVKLDHKEFKLITDELLEFAQPYNDLIVKAVEQGESIASWIIKDVLQNLRQQREKNIECIRSHFLSSGKIGRKIIWPTSTPEQDWKKLRGHPRYDEAIADLSDWSKSVVTRMVEEVDKIDRQLEILQNLQPTKTIAPL